VCVALIAGLCLPTAATAQEPTFRIAFQRDGTQSDLWLVDSDGTGEEPLTRTSTPEATPAWSPDASTIVYACAPNGNWDLCTIDINTREVKQLTNTPADEFEPQFTPDGSQIVFELYPGGRNADVALMPADGGKETPLTSTPGADDQDPFPDPNSSLVAFSSNGNIKTVDTNEGGQVTTVTSAKRGDGDPVFSSDGEIAFARRVGRSYDLFTATSDGQITAQPTSGSAQDLEPSFTKDGAKVAFARQADPRARFQIFLMDANGQDQQPVSQGGAYDDLEPAVEPAAAAIARAWSELPVARLSVSCHTINGSGASQTINGTKKADCIHAKAGNDIVNGNAGNDRIWGDAGRDTLNGGSGNDWFDALDLEQDVVNGGTGADHALIDKGLDAHSSVAIL
jgi:Tol biopolymer transport system component